MVPFRNTLPYERVAGDLYIRECPFCHAENVLLVWKKKDINELKEQIKKRLVMPCCRESIIITEADDDYLLADIPLR